MLKLKRCCCWFDRDGLRIRGWTYIFENYFQQITQKEKKINNKKGSSVPIHALVLIHLLIVQWNTGRLLLHEAIYLGQHGFNFKLVIFQVQFIKQKVLTLFLFINLFVWLFGLERKPCCWCDDEPDEDWGEPRLSCSPWIFSPKWTLF